jgi:hypothetical protein
MIVYDLYVQRAACAFGPTKADAPLLVDANAELAGSVTHQRLQPIASQHSQMLKARGRVEYLQSLRGLLRKAQERPYDLAVRELGGPLVPIVQES